MMILPDAMVLRSHGVLMDVVAIFMQYVCRHGLIRGKQKVSMDLAHYVEFL
jgi:hypothetical protein